MQLFLTDRSYHPATWYPENGGNVTFGFTINLDPANVPETVTANLEIYDQGGSRGGNLVRVMSEDIFTDGFPTVEAAFEWDGTDSAGEMVPFGRYGPSFGASADGYESISEDFCSGNGVDPLCSLKTPGEEDPDDEKVCKCDGGQCQWVNPPKAGGPKAKAPSAKTTCESANGGPLSVTSGGTFGVPPPSNGSSSSSAKDPYAGFRDPMSHAGFLGPQGFDSPMSHAGFVGSQGFDGPMSHAGFLGSQGFNHPLSKAGL